MFISFSSPVNVSTSSYLRFCARLSSYSRATSVSVFVSFSFAVAPLSDSPAFAAFRITLENSNSPEVEQLASELSVLNTPSGLIFSFKVKNYILIIMNTQMYHNSTYANNSFMHILSKNKS